MRRTVVLPLVALCGLAAVLGLRAGQPVSETEILQAVAARYLDLAGAGAAATDCAAVPGEGDVRMVVTCGGPGAGWRFDIGRRGAVLREMALTEQGA